MSALPPKADIGRRASDVRFVPKADILHCSNNAGLLGQVLPNPATTPRHYFIVMPAGAIAAGMFGGGGHGPDSTPTKAALSEIGSGLAKLCWTSLISAGVICLFIFLSLSRFDFGATR